MNEGWLCLGKGGVAFWMETEELNCPKKLGQEPGIVQGQRQAEQGWSIREVDTGGHPWKGLQSGGLEHPLTFTYFMPFKKKQTNFLFIYLFDCAGS